MEHSHRILQSQKKGCVFEDMGIENNKATIMSDERNEDRNIRSITRPIIKDRCTQVCIHDEFIDELRYGMNVHSDDKLYEEPMPIPR